MSVCIFAFKRAVSTGWKITTTSPISLLRAMSTATVVPVAPPALTSRRREGLPVGEDTESSPDARRLRVVATYNTTRVDVARLARLAMHEWKLSDTQCKIEKDWAIFRIPSKDVYVDELSLHTNPVTHISVSRRGAVVVVNAPHSGKGTLPGKYNLDLLLQDRTITPGVLAGDLMEDLYVVLKQKAVSPSDAEEWARMNRRGELVLQVDELELDAVRMVNSCMAQTVNLQYFEGKVDRMFEIVQDIFKLLESGSASKLNAKVLYKHLADASNISNAVMLSGLRNTVRPGSTAWNEERYAKLQDVLWNEFDLEDRYEELERSLNWILETIKYGLEVAKDYKTINLERLIVLLIAAELAISIGHTGTLTYFLSLLGLK